MTLSDSWKKIQQVGPTALLVTPTDAQPTVLVKKANPDVTWDLIYIRRDGWSLGCEFYMAQHAEALHRDDWVALVRRGDIRPKKVNFHLDK
jgi:hypothetical protein